MTIGVERNVSSPRHTIRGCLLQLQSTMLKPNIQAKCYADCQTGEAQGRRQDFRQTCLGETP